MASLFTPAPYNTLRKLSAGRNNVSTKNLPKQIVLKRSLRLREESFSPVKRAEKPHVIALKFQPGLKYELGNAHRLSCECKNAVLQTFPTQF